MNTWIYYDIPRIYTAVTQWMACMVYILILGRKYGRVKTGVFSVLFLALQGILLVCTENVAIILWAPVMALSACLMWLMLSTLCRAGRRETAYAAACAFLAAETAASFEWLFHYYFVYIYKHSSWMVSFGLLAFIYGLLFYAVWMAEKKLLDRVNGFSVSAKELCAVLGTVIFIFILSNLSFIYTDTPLSSRLFYEVFRIRALIDILGIMAVFFYQFMLREQFRVMESEAINRVLKSQYEKYLHQQETDELVSIKYHDLKHQIAALRSEVDQKKKDEWLDSIEREIDTYKMTVNSGSKVLDSILENKLANAQKHQIEMTYVVDGKLLDFIHVTDICTIFGNALDNAIEAELLEPESEKRLIHLSVSAQRKMVCVTVENYVSRPEKIEADSLKTTKPDKRYHGYGIKSIRYCVEKYHGNVSIKVKGNWFSICMLIPSA